MQHLTIPVKTKFQQRSFKTDGFTLTLYFYFLFAPRKCSIKRKKPISSYGNRHAAPALLLLQSENVFSTKKYQRCTFLWSSICSSKKNVVWKLPKNVSSLENLRLKCPTFATFNFYKTYLNVCAKIILNISSLKRNQIIEFSCQKSRLWPRIGLWKKPILSNFQEWGKWEICKLRLFRSDFQTLWQSRSFQY